MKSKSRPIVVDGIAYRWRYKPPYRPTARALLEGIIEWECFDTFMAYLVTKNTNSLIIYFVTWENGVDGGPLRVGASISLDNLQSSRVNLHTPKLASQIIRQARKRGWNPESDNTDFVIEDGLQLLAEIGYIVK